MWTALLDLKTTLGTAVKNVYKRDTSTWKHEVNAVLQLLLMLYINVYCICRSNCRTTQNFQCKFRNGTRCRKRGGFTAS